MAQDHVRSPKGEHRQSSAGDTGFRARCPASGHQQWRRIWSRATLGSGALAGIRTVRDGLDHVSVTHVEQRVQFMRILVVGAGVIGSVYAGKLLAAGHQVVMFARGRRLAELQSSGLILADAGTGKQSAHRVTAVGDLGGEERYDLVVVSVRAEQLTSTLPVLKAMKDDSAVLFLGNTNGFQDRLVQELGGRAVLGFPAAGGVVDGKTVRYVLVKQQKTMLGETTGAITPRTRDLKAIMEDAGFPTRITVDMRAWLVGHSAFIAPIAYALYRSDIDTARLAADGETLRLMVQATKQAFQALRGSGNGEIPANLRTLYLKLPEAFVVSYWRRIMAGPRGELWFGAHTRAAPEEMRVLAKDLRTAIAQTGLPAPELTKLLSPTA